jgi:hypothetical protein
MSHILEASPATKLGFILTGVDKSEGYWQRQRYPASERRAEAPRLRFTVSPFGADGDGEAWSRRRRRSETQTREKPNETASERETDARGDKPASGAPAHAASKSAGRPFGGLSPREAAQKSAQIRKAKSAQRKKAAGHAALDEAQDALKDV